MRATPSPWRATEGGKSYETFSLTQKHPFNHKLATKTRGVVKDIPFFVEDNFLRSVNRDPYKLAQVEKMMYKSYETYLINECRQQKKYKKQLEQEALNHRGSKEAKQDLVNKARDYQTHRCQEHEDLYYRGSRR